MTDVFVSVTDTFEIAFTEFIFNYALSLISIIRQ